MPDPAGATAPLDDAECAKVKGFLARLAAHGSSAVVITSRTAEDWLGPRPPHRGRRAGAGGSRPVCRAAAGPLPGGGAAAGPAGVRGAAGVAGRAPAEHAADPAPPGRQPTPRRCWTGCAAPPRCPAAMRAGTGPRRWPPASPTPSPTSPQTHGGCCPPSACSTASPTPTSSPSSPERRVSRAGSPGPAARTGHRPWMTRPGWGCSPRWARACTGSTPPCRPTSPRGGAPRTPTAMTACGTPRPGPWPPRTPRFGILAEPADRIR